MPASHCPEVVSRCLPLSPQIQLRDSVTQALGNSTGHRTATMTAPLPLTSGPVMYEAVLRSCRTNPVGGRVPTCDSAHTWRLYYSVSSQEHQSAGTMTCYPTQMYHVMVPAVRFSSGEAL